MHVGPWGASNGAEVSESSPLRLIGSATDAEDGPLDPAQLTWASDRDGVLATGDRLYIEGRMEYDNIEKNGITIPTADVQVREMNRGAQPR